MRESETACLCELQAWYSQPRHTKSDICRVWGARGMLRKFYRHGVRRTSPIRGKDNQVVIVTPTTYRSVSPFKTQYLVVLFTVFTHVLRSRLSAMHTEAMLDYECLNYCWVKAHILDESIVVKNMGMGI